jgi:hypothetical protein
VTAPEPTAATRTPTAAISRAVFNRGSSGSPIARARVLTALRGQLGDQDQGGTDHDQAPTTLIDAQERRRDQGTQTPTNSSVGAIDQRIRSRSLDGV